MEFTGFCPQGLDLLIENRIHNAKPFYEAHKTQIKAWVQEPYYALIERMQETMLEIDPQFVIVPHRQLSRIRRDTRYTKDKTLYRDHTWISFGRKKGERFSERPNYYFEITPEYWGYGCGYYCAPAKEMQIAREMILKEDKRFLDAYRAVNKSAFALYGEQYKRPKHPEAAEKYQTWINRKNLGLHWQSNDHQPIFRGTFVEEMLENMKKIAPFYYFLCTIKEQAGTGANL